MSHSFPRRTVVRGIGATALTGVVGSGVGAAASDGTQDETGAGGTANAGRVAFTACSFNVRYDNPDDEYTWEERRSRVAGTITDLAPDLLGVQEALPNQYDDLRESVDEYEWYGVGREDGDREGEMVPVAWRRNRFETVETGEFWLSETPTEPSVGWDADLPRVTTWASLRERETGERVWLCNTHFSHVGETVRAESARLLRDRARARAADGEAVVLTGDFNVAPTGAPYEILMGTEGRAGSPLFDPRREATTDTVHGPWGTYQGFTENIGDRIDYVFTLDTASVDRYRTLDVQPGAYRSDHLPVVAEFTYPTDDAPSGGESEPTNYQVDFVAGDPIEQLGEGGLYAEQDRLLRYAWGSTEEGITDRGSAWASAEVRECLENYGHVGRTDGEARVTFTVADGCELTLSLAVHSLPGREFSAETADEQELLDSETDTYGPGEHTIAVPLPE